MFCKKCGHPSALHRYLEELPLLKRPCLVKDCECRDYESEIEVGKGIL